MPIKIYEGRFGEESFLFNYHGDLPNVGNFIFYNEQPYRVLYYMIDVDNFEYSVFVRKSIEEDF